MSRISFWLAAILITASSLFAQDVRYNFDKNADFTKFKTYRWVPIKDAQSINPIIEKQIVEAIDAQLVQKGLSKVDGDKADLYIGYQTAIGTEKQFNSYSTDWGYCGGWYGGGWYGGGMGSSMTSGSTTTIYKGQLALDMYDSSNHTLVWRGLASKTLDAKAKPDKQTKKVNKAVTKLLKNYPPKVKS